MIIDCHAHVFPHLGGACGWESAEQHRDYLAKFLYNLARPGEGEKPGYWDSKLSINFRVGKFGRMEFTENGVDYYRQFMPPSLEGQAASPELIIAEMDHAGVDMAVLQNGKPYGRLNDYFAECVRKYPDRLVGTGQVNEFEADKESGIKKLKYVVKELGFNAIFFGATTFWETGNPTAFNDRKYDPFWGEVSDLGIAVMWDFPYTKAHYMDQMRALSSWADKFPAIPSIVTVGILLRTLIDDKGEIKFPKDMLTILKKPNIFVEVAYPIQTGSLIPWDYPYPEAQKLIKWEYEELGGEKLLWGSDMPNVVRNCTYRQSLTFLTRYCDFITPKDMALITGGNIARILKIKTDIPRTPGPKPAN